MQITPELMIGTVIGLLASFLYAISVVVYRSVSDEARPIAISSIKMWVALIFMTFLILLSSSYNLYSIELQSVFFLALSVTLGAVVGDTVFLASQNRIGVSSAFPIAGSYPILTYFLAIVLIGESVVISRFFGVMITVFGVIVITREQNTNNHEDPSQSSIDIIGVMLAIVTMILYAFATVFLQLGVTNVEPIEGTFVRVLVGSLEFMPMFLLARHFGMSKPTRQATKKVIIAGFFGMAIGALLYVTTVKLVGATIGSVLGSTSPLFAVPISIIYLKERVTWKTGLGTVLTVLGVILVVFGF